MVEDFRLGIRVVGSAGLALLTSAVFWEYRFGLCDLTEIAQTWAVFIIVGAGLVLGLLPAREVPRG